MIWLNPESEIEGLHVRYHHPGRLKWECRDKLDHGNITERVLFPGLHGLSSWLRRHFSPKENPSGGKRE